MRWPSDDKRCAKGLQGLIRIAARKRLHTDWAGVAHVVQSLGDTSIIDLACARFTAARNIGHLHFADPRQAGPAKFDEISLAYLRMIKIKVQTQTRMVDR